MALLDGKNRIQHWAEALTGQDDLKGMARSAMLSALEAENATNGVSAPARKVSRPALMLAGGVAGVTAASAAVSAYRHSHSDA